MSHYEAILRKRVRHALEHILQLERTGYGRALARILRELADELDPPTPKPGDA
jgi:hypothetical protein